MNENKVPHLTFIQGVINRMGQNSFLLKGWSVTLLAALFALSSKDSNKNYVLIAYFPIFMFWGLDAFFLHQEKLFRELYSRVAKDIITSEHFSLSTAGLEDEVDSFWTVAFSKTLLPFHGIMFLIVLIVMFII